MGLSVHEACQGCTNIAVRPFGERRPMMLERILEERVLFRVHRIVSLSEIRRSGVEVLKTDPDDVRVGCRYCARCKDHGAYMVSAAPHLNCRVLVERGLRRAWARKYAQETATQPTHVLE